MSVNPPAVSDLPIGYFGASTGAAAALVAAADRPDLVHAVVSRGGRPDLANQALARVHAPLSEAVSGPQTMPTESPRRLGMPWPGCSTPPPERSCSAKT